MKTSDAGVIILCVLAALTLSCESAYQQLNSINDLRTIDFGRSVPRHSVLLLHWFANAINDRYNEMTLSFNPNGGFGSHHYKNSEHLLDPQPQGYRYYTVGNLNQEFPTYVRNPSIRGYDGGNRDRIVFSAQRLQSGDYRVDRVFLTATVNNK
ncbi:hypothetical protein WMY93_003604 [Mugilogobius chulae]|uniref:Uncharacterized protein n=1 Tax=Mugilogobius chulae TaxID=88201 RepID=A0AAW0PWM4_9GOBI